MKKRKFTVILEPEEDGGYAVHCPALRGCVSQGDNRKDALMNIKEAIQLVLEVLEKDEDLLSARVFDAMLSHGVRLPDESPDRIADEIREILKARKEDGRPLTVETVEVLVATPVAA